MRLSTFTPVLLSGLAAAKVLKQDVLPTRPSPPTSAALEKRFNTQPKELRSTTWSAALAHGDMQFKTVSAEMTIPNITFPYGYNASAYYGASVWVGISGFGDLCWSYCPVYQTGFYYLWDIWGDAGVFAFHEWAPAEDPVFLDNTEGFTIAVGDRIRMTVTQYGNLTGETIFENLSAGRSSKNVRTQPPVDPNGNEVALNSTMVEWAIEGWMANDQSSLFPDFGTLVFEDMRAVDVDDKRVDLAEPGRVDTVDMQPLLDGRYLTDCRFDAGKLTTSCEWLGYKDIFPNAG